jgi:hypothetical protein
VENGQAFKVKDMVKIQTKVKSSFSSECRSVLKQSHNPPSSAVPGHAPMRPQQRFHECGSYTDRRAVAILHERSGAFPVGVDVSALHHLLEILIRGYDGVNGVDVDGRRCFF